MASKNNNTKITIALLALLMVAVMAIPVLFGYFSCPRDKVFLGITGLRPIEQFYYLSMGPSQAVNGDLLFSDTYGRIPPEKVLLNPIANVIGFVSTAFHVPLPIAFNIFRVFSGLLLVFAFYYLSRSFITSPVTRILALTIFAFSAGFDFFFEHFHISGIDAVDDSIPEANMFIAISGEYYLALANALFILTLATAYRVIYKKEKVLLLCAFSLFLLSAVYAYGLVSAGLIILTLALYEGRSTGNIMSNFRTLLKLSVFCLPVCGYYIWLLQKFPVIGEDGWFPFPGFLSLLSTFGFGFSFIIIGFSLKERKLLVKEGFLLLWICVTLFLIYLPQSLLPIQVQLLIGLGAPISIMFATTLGRIANLIRDKIFPSYNTMGAFLAGVLSICVVSLSSFTNLKFYANQFRELKQHTLPCYMNKEMYEAMMWSSKNIPPEDLVIVSRDLGFIFSAFTACRVYTGVAGFKQQTAEQKNMERWLQLIHENKVEEASVLLSKTQADYLFLDRSFVHEDPNELAGTLKTSYPIRFQNSEVLILGLR